MLKTVLLAAAASTLAASPTPPVICDASADCTLHIPSGGMMRSFILHVPDSYNDAKPLPLVFILHGFGGDKEGMRGLTAMNDKADEEGFFVAYLDGTPCQPNPDEPVCSGQLAWNSGVSPSLGIVADDVQFVRDLIARISGAFRVDSHRIYAAGFSNGGMMTYRLAAEMSDVLAGVAIAEGTMGAKRPADPEFNRVPDAIGSIPILIMHGTDDPSIPLEGGVCLAGGNNVCLSVADALAYWTNQNSCQEDGLQSTNAAGDVRTSYRACFANSDVVQITINGGTHTWPGIGTDAAWNFFSAHARTAQ